MWWVPLFSFLLASFCVWSLLCSAGVCIPCLLCNFSLAKWEGFFFFFFESHVAISLNPAVEGTSALPICMWLWNLWRVLDGSVSLTAMSAAPASRRKGNGKALPWVLFNLVPLSMSYLQGEDLLCLSPGACLIGIRVGLSAVTQPSDIPPPHTHTQSGTEELALCKAMSPCGRNPSAELVVSLNLQLWSH